MNITNLRIKTDYETEWYVEVEHPINNIKIGYATEKFLSTELVSHALDNTDIKTLTVLLNEDHNTLVYRATFPEGATIGHIIVVMQGIVNDAERYIRQLRAVWEVAKLNCEKQDEPN